MTDATGARESVVRWIAWRYLIAGRHQYARFIAWVSLTGIALGVAVLIVVLSVMNGFDRELSGRILGTVPHVLVESTASRATATGQPTVPIALDELPGVQAALPFYQSQGMLTRSSSVSGVAVYGIEPAAAAALPVLADSASGALSVLLAEPRSIVLGAPLARRLGLFPGDPVVLMMTRVVDGRVRPQLERFQLSGTFELGAELDFALVLVRLADVSGPRFAGTGRFGTRLVLSDPFASQALTPELATSLGEGWRVSDWSATYGELFRAVRLEKSMMFLLLVLIVGIAAFNIVAGQAMLVNDKRGDIAILRTMGAGDATVLRIFVLQGCLTAATGVLLGVLLGVVLANNITELVALGERFFGGRILDGTYFLEVPVQLEWGDVGFVVLIALAVSVIAAIVPARKSLAVSPVVALHEF